MSDLGNKLVLYRGDGQKIDRFMLSQTDPYSLYGRGIYLTNSLEIARTYQFKDHHDILKQHISSLDGHINKLKWSGFKVFKHHYASAFILNPSDRLNHKVLVELYQELLDEGTIRLVRTSVKGRVTYYSVILIYKRPGNQPTVHKFVFDHEDFKKRVLNVRRPKDQQVLKDIMSFYKNQNWRWNSPMIKMTDMVVNGISSRMFSSNGYRDDIDMNLVLKVNDYVGIEYPGGRHLKTGIHHRAFSIIDEDFVNTHYVGTVE